MTATDTAGVAGTAAFSITTGVIVPHPGNRGNANGAAIADLALTANGGTASYTWTATGLPTGLSINATTGVITGTPTVDGTYSVIATATDTAGVSGATGFTWNVGPAPQLTDPGTKVGTIGVPLSLPITVTGGKAPYTWAGSALPSGLSINTSTGVISGTPTSATTPTVKVTVTDSLKIVNSVSFVIAVAPAVAVVDPGTQNDGVGAPVSTTFNAGGGKYPYTWTATGLPAGLSLNASTGTVTGTPTTTGTNAVTVTATDSAGRTGTLSLTWNIGSITVANPGGLAAPTGVAYSKAITASGGTAPYTWSATGLPPGITINASTGVLSGTPTTAGNYTTRVTATDTTGVPGTVSFGFATGVIATHPGNRGNATGTAIPDLTIVANGGTKSYTWTATGLPPGLSINPSTGVISGTPTTDGAYSVIATATDTAGVSGATGFTWNIGPATQLTDPGSQAATLGVAMSLPITATGGKAPYTWAAAWLPSGLSINSSTGVISGTPTMLTTSPVTVTVTDSLKIASTVSFPITVTNPVTVTDPGTHNDAAGSTVTAVALTAAGGSGTYTWTTTGLPTGLSVNASTGVISGVPAAAGTSAVTVTATDSAGRSATRSFTWNVALALTAASIDAQSGTVGIAVSPVTLTATGGKSPYSWSAAGLPAGLSLAASTGVISGAPTAVGSPTVQATVTDADGRTNITTFTWTVATPVTIHELPTQDNTVGVNGSVTVSASGGAAPYTWTATGLPDGLSIDTTTGIISGTPAAAISTTVTITATDAAHRTGSLRVAWNVGVPVSLANPGTQNGTVGVPASLQLAGSGGTGSYTWTATALPDGLTLNASTGLITGQPTTEGTWTAGITITDTAGRTATVWYTWTVALALAAVNPGDQSTIVGQQVNLTLAAGGGTAPYTWTMAGLPSGVTVDPATGVVTGSPITASAGSTVTVTLTDAVGRTDHTAFTWTVRLATPTGLTANAQGLQTVELAWAPVAGATGYRIYRDGAPVTTTGTDPHLWDRQLDGSTTYRYRITAVDADGLETASSAEAVVTTTPTPEAPTNYAVCPQDDTLPGCAYTASIPAGAAHPDSNGTSLTDGVHGQVTGGAAWQGRHNVDEYTFTVDLGVSRPLTEINSGWLQNKSDSVELPLTVSYALSNDGHNFTGTALVSRPYASAADQVRPYRAAGLNTTARYVRVTVNGSAGWTMVDEVEARGVVAQALPALTLSAPTANPVDQDHAITPLPVTVAEPVGPFSWSADGLPDGLTIDRSTGVITGIVRAAGVFTITVTATSTKGRIGHASIPLRVYAATAKGPVMNSGTVAGVGPDAKSGGVAVVDGYAYTITGNKVVRLDPAAGKNATAQTVAGSDTNGCTDAGTGSQARFYASSARIIGTDGSLLYVYDYNCGVRAVNPTTGATRTMTGLSANTSSTVDGRYLYTAATYGNGIVRYDLQTGQATNLFGTVSLSSSVLAADNTYVWAFNNNDYKLYRLDPAGVAETKTFTLPTNGVTAARSAGDYVYYADSRNLLTRVNKNDGSLQVVAGDGAHNDDLLYNTTAIAADGTNLYTAGDHGIAKLTVTPRTYTPTATGPVMNSGTVAGVGPDAKSGGVAVVDGYAYTITGNKVVRLDPAAGKNATAQTVAGSDTNGCTDAGTGSQARFYASSARIIGTDGSLLYVYDYNCGVRAVNPTTGATRTMTGLSANTSSTVDGRYLYTAATYGNGIVRYDLQTGQATNLFGTVSLSSSVLAADNTYVWAFNNNDYKLYRLDPAGVAETKTFTLPTNGVTAARSAGDYVYYADSRNLLTRVNKNDGSLQVVAGDGAHNDDLLYNTTAIAADGTNLYTAGDHGIAKLTTVVRVYEEPAVRAPDFGDVRPVGPDVRGSGMAVVDGYAYTITGNKVVRLDPAAGKNATAQTVAGSDTNGCTDAGTGSQARFYASSARIIGTDGSLLYVYDYNCGVRAVNPTTGATRTLTGVSANTGSTIAGRYLYTGATYGNGVVRYDLQAGQATTLFGTMSLSNSVLAADNTRVWAFNNNDGKLYRLDPTGTTETTTYALPGTAVTAARSAGDYVYYADDSNLLTRVNKNDGSLQVVAGDGAHNDDLLYNTTAIAADGTNLYTAGDHGIAKLTVTTRTYTPPATGPVMYSGKITRVGPDRWVKGVTLVSGLVYTAVGSNIVEAFLDGSNENVQAGGGGAADCAHADAGEGSRATFFNPSVIGNDGRQIYVADGCGLREVNWLTGATRTIKFQVNARSVVGDHYIYTTDSYGKLWRYDLTARKTTRLYADMTMTGPLAADTTSLWAFNNNDGKLYQLDPSGNNPAKPFPLPTSTASTALSVGNYIYYTDGSNLLRRIDKRNGNLQIIAGDGAQDDDLLFGTMGIASDNFHLYAAGEHGLYSITAATRQFASAQKDIPILDALSPQTQVDLLGGKRSGIAVVGYDAFTASRATVTKTNIYTPAKPTALSTGTGGCSDAGKGGKASFYDASVIGYDGSLLYVADTYCGVRAVNPDTGSTRTLLVPGNSQSSIGGRYLYTIDASNTLLQYGLKTGVTNVVERNIAPGSLMVATEDAVYLVNNRTVTEVSITDTGGQKAEGSIGTSHVVTANLPYRVTGSDVAYANGGLYVTADVPPAPGTEATVAASNPSLVRIALNSATEYVILRSIWSGDLTGITVAKHDVYVLYAGGGSDMTTLGRIHNQGLVDSETHEDMSFYVEEGTAYIPTGHLDDLQAMINLFDRALEWNPATHMCVNGCQGIKAAADEAAQTVDKGFWHDVACSVKLCDTADDWEQSIIKAEVDKQAIYDENGRLRPDGKLRLFRTQCIVEANRAEDCDLYQEITDKLRNVETVADVLATIYDFLPSRGGLRPETCPHSFRGDTRVLMADGGTTAIQDIRLGQQVLAGDPASQTTAAQSVTALHVNADTELTDLTLADGSMVHTTAHHPFWTPQQQTWTDASDLVAGMTLGSTSGSTTSVKLVHNFTGNTTMYDLTVDRLHTYYVLAGNTPVLVHNCGGESQITDERLAHIEYRHGPGARERAIQEGETDIPGEFNEEFMWEGDDMVLGDRLRRGVDSTPELPNERGPGHIHQFDYGSPVGVNGAGNKTNIVEVVVRDGKIWTAYPK
ncbi:hypothetical protein KRMM14A1259_18620 [Krasilnikovia sp. MM14-A1259]